MSTDVKIPQADTQVRGGGNGKDIKLPIYMDNHATTPMDPRVLEEMLPYFMEKFGNAASRNHSFGWVAEEGTETARERIAKLIGATTKEVIFTSGATESDNLAIKGVAEMYREKGNHIITAVTEHKAVLDTCKRLEKNGYRVTYLPVQKDGLVDLEELKRAIDDKTILVTIMAANNEIGVLQPIAEIGKICRERGVIFHSDAVQAIGKVPIDVNKMNIDVASITGHKLYGPKGVGFLFHRARDRMGPIRLKTCQPSAASTRRAPSKLPRRLASLHRSRTAAAALFPAAATKVLRPIGPATCRGGSPVSRFPSSTPAA